MHHCRPSYVHYAMWCSSQCPKSAHNLVLSRSVQPNQIDQHIVVQMCRPRLAGCFARQPWKRSLPGGTAHVHLLQSFQLVNAGFRQHNIAMRGTCNASRLRRVSCQQFQIEENDSYMLAFLAWTLC
jgi:hypothetical protein